METEALFTKTEIMNVNMKKFLKIDNDLSISLLYFIQG